MNITVKKTGGFLRSNWAYLVWFALYFSFTVIILELFVNDLKITLLYSCLLYIASVGIALSPMGESIARILENARPLRTQNEMNYLYPIFQEVYQEALKCTPTLNKDIQLYISDSMIINAYALGRKTVILTAGAIEVFSAEELKGILSHELGHHANGDTKALLIKVVGNAIFTIAVFVLQILLAFINSITFSVAGKNIVLLVVAFIVYIFKMLIDVFVFLFLSLGEIIIAFNSRYSELLADKYAYHTGYGQELINALYILSKISLPSKMSLTDKLKSSHPHITARISQLEQFYHNGLVHL